MDWSQFIQKLFELAGPYLDVRKDLPHAQVSHQYALRLLQTEGGNYRIVEPAVILHDVGWSKLTPEEIKMAYGVRISGEEAARLNRIHEIEGAVIAGQLLQNLNYDPALTEQITLMISRHDSGRHPDSLEEKLLQDADKLWRFSAVGFWEEIQRQGLEPWELYHFLAVRRPKWFHTATALTLAEEELKDRDKELG